MFKKLLCVLLLAAFPALSPAGEPVRIHSHNDYHLSIPFYRAYSQQVYSLEADIRLEEGSGALRVCHDVAEMADALDIEQMYLRPLAFLFEQNGGRAWMRSDQRLTLMVDLKTPLHPTIDGLIERMLRYPEVFDCQINPHAVRVVITGSRPDPATFGDYPPFILFDGFVDVDYTPEQLERVGFMSDYFGNYSRWKGQGEMPESDRAAIRSLAEASHRQGKLLRLWGAPDTPEAWATLRALGLDIINTDHPEACTAYFKESE